MVAIIDYNVGNVKSLQFALERLGVKSILTNDYGLIKKSEKVIFPGQGAASTAMDKLKEVGLDKLIPNLKQPVLGICLGMQLLCENTEEGDVDGLGIIKCNVIKFSDKLKVPQMGWNKVKKLRTRLFNKINEGDYMYLVHSYFVPTINETIGQSEYGLTYSVAVQKENFFGVQFHPEKSSSAGSQLLKNFLEL
ncbi:MAG: imidazole glycerol phosphate synthase subunit HisH [Bacteroidota bacterium]|jgi:glutamine amidotransferase|nr:imidazole glycerol phosphate synthase subunit HisH [Bacteroidota bacterium]|tara:strand:+ start:4244 stop:4822 length:579 start_codon:yes stop_codon:yes gene_type:complete